MSLNVNRIYKLLQTLSYGTNEQIAVSKLLNNILILSPEMQQKFYRDLLKVGGDY